MSKKQVLMGAVIATAAWVVAGAADAACKQGFCMSGHDYPDRGNHYVDFTTSLTKYTHFNVWNGKEQVELGKNERSFWVWPVNRFPPGLLNSQVPAYIASLPKGLRYVYKIQACNKGGAFSSSSCTPWVTFTHTRFK